MQEASQLGNRVPDIVAANSVFGEMALMDNAPRGAAAIAATDAALPAIFGEAVPVLCQ